MNRILIIQTAFLGDVILATPVICELKRLFPESEIDVLVKKGNESLLANNTSINNVLILNKADGKWKSLWSLIKKIRRHKYDLVINLHRFGSSGLITALSGSRSKYGFRKNPFSFLFTKAFQHNIGDGTHEVSRNLSLIREFGSVDLRRPELFPGEDNYNKVKEYVTDKYYCLAPASVWFTKQLPEQKWVELISQLNSKGTVYLLGAQNDHSLCQRIIDQTSGSNTINLCGKLNLLDSAALMSSARMNYVNDSGPLHIASAMNAPVTSFFCSTVPDFGFGPLADQSKIVQVKEKLPCRPCGLHGHNSCPKGHFKCGNDISISEIEY